MYEMTHLQAERSRNREVVLGKTKQSNKKTNGYVKVTYFQEMARVSQANYLTRADQGMSD